MADADKDKAAADITVAYADADAAAATTKDNDERGPEPEPEPVQRRPKRRQARDIFTQWTFGYMNSIIRKGVKTELTVDDFFDVEDRDDSEAISTRILNAWSQETARATSVGGRPQLWRTMVRVFGWDTFMAGVPYAIETVVKIGEALMLGVLLTWFQDPEGTIKDGCIAALGLSLLSLAHAVLHHIEFFASMRLGMQIRIGFIASIYRKCLALSLSHTSSTGLIVNIVSNDCQRFEDVAPFWHFWWLGPVEVVIIAGLMYREIGPSALAAVFGLLCLIPIQFWFAKAFGDLRKKTVGLRDERIKALSDSIAGIQVVKLFAWEPPFSAKINEFRDSEVDWIRKSSRLQALNETFYFVSPSVIEILMFVTYWLTGGTLTPAKVFSCLVYLSILRLSMANFFPKSLRFSSECMVSMQRIQAFLSLPEVSARRDPVLEAELLASLEEKDVAIFIKDGTFSWGSGLEDDVAAFKKNEKSNPSVGAATSASTSKLKTVLHDIQLMVKASQLVAVVGPVGAGKSSLLNAILGEMDPSNETRVALRSRKVAYCTQSPFILSGTVKENITFGHEVDEKRLNEVVEACAMTRDLTLFPDGLETMIGEKGVTLSGGQRARLALARACYADADIVLLDDPLSAVDTRVGRHIYENCLRGYLSGKTVVLVTHQLQFARLADKVVVMEGGRISAMGSFEEVAETGEESGFAKSMIALAGRTARKDGEEELDVDDLFAESEDAEGEDKEVKIQKEEISIEDATLENDASSEDKEEKGASAKEAPSEGPAKQHGAPLIKAEEMARGTVSLSTYTSFFNAGTGPAAALGLLLLLVLGEVTLVLSDWYLSKWSQRSADDQKWVGNPSIFVALVAATVVVGSARSLLFFRVCLNATQELFRRMLTTVFRSPMHFFQSNPHGRIMNRFSKDMNMADELLPFTFFDFAQCAFMICGTLGIAVAVMPFTLLSVPIISVVFYFLRKYYIATSRQIKRFEAVTRSPVYSTVPATLDGLAVIRAFGNEEPFKRNFVNIQNENTRIFFCFLSCARWLGLRLDVLSSVFLAAVTFLSIGIKNSPYALSAGTVGLLLSYTLQLLGLLQWAVRQSAELENLMVSVERILEYTNIPSEAPVKTDLVPPDNWPSKGEVRVEDMSLSYPTSVKPVLHNLSFVIPGGAKVGIVGRTGAGKSSMLQALFRLVEPTPERSITIDGIPISALGLADLRSRIAIVAQEPFCFKGTLRFNLDPFNKHSDAELWSALDGVGLKPHVETLRLKLEAPVSENGSNWSVGERQLICLARAVLRNSKLLVMDEATSSVDMKTDALVQKAIRADGGMFQDSTVITIAHRLMTVIDFDLILVLDAGRVMEYGSPHELLQKSVDDEGAWFAKMVNEMGPSSRDQLIKIAAEKEAQRLLKAASNPVSSST